MVNIVSNSKAFHGHDCHAHTVNKRYTGETNMANTVSNSQKHFTDTLVTLIQINVTPERTT